jgi:isopenicillin N synthase-like dioxygenase
MKNLFELSEEEKKKILEKHKEATKGHYVKKDELKKGLQQPDKKGKTSN